MAKKYANGLPLARQKKIWAREGVAVSRAAMSVQPGLPEAFVQAHEAAAAGKSVSI